MELEEMVRYLTWVVFFGIALAGIYFLLRALGISF